MFQTKNVKEWVTCAEWLIRKLQDLLLLHIGTALGIAVQTTAPL